MINSSLREERRRAAARRMGERRPVWTLYGGTIAVGVAVFALAGLAVWAVRSAADGLSLPGLPGGGWLVGGLALVMVAVVGGLVWLKRYFDGY